LVIPLTHAHNDRVDAGRDVARAVEFLSAWVPKALQAILTLAAHRDSSAFS
jgi:hypothetical protein